MTTITTTVHGWVALLAGTHHQAAPAEGSDRELIRRSRDGDRRAFARLVDRYGDRAYSLARRLVADPGLAEDVTQEAFLRAYRALGDFDLERPLLPWLTTIVRNLASNARRRRVPEPVEVGPGAADPVSPSSGPPEAAARRERERMVEGAVAELPERYREVVVLRYLQDRPVREVAELAGLPEGTVKTFLHRARQELRRKLGRRLRETP